MMLMMENSRHVFLIATHVLSDKVHEIYANIEQSVSGYGEVFILYNQPTEEAPQPVGNAKISAFRNSILQDLRYIPIQDTLVPGSNHFSLLHFYLNNPRYTFYWYIEYDAVFNGNWRVFFDAFKSLKTDFISTRIELYGSIPLWHWWNTLNHPHKTIPMEDRVSSFNPVYRISVRALAFIHEALLDRWSGHHEVLLPTLLYRNDFKIMDFGGRGRFVPPGFRDKFYTLQTYRWRPVFPGVGNLKDKIYHPVK